MRAANSQHPLPTLGLTRHASVRCKQRGISPEMIGLLFEFGRERHVGGGATLLSFPKRCRERLRKSLPRNQFAAISSHLDVYAVLGDHGAVMTAGHRYHHLKEK